MNRKLKFWVFCIGIALSLNMVLGQVPKQNKVGKKNLAKNLAIEEIHFILYQKPFEREAIKQAVSQCSRQIAKGEGGEYHLYAAYGWYRLQDFLRSYEIAHAGYIWQEKFIQEWKKKNTSIAGKKKASENSVYEEVQRELLTELDKMRKRAKGRMEIEIYRERLKKENQRKIPKKSYQEMKKEESMKTSEANANK